MARPTKHPKTGVYQFRRVVPKELRPLVGKGEEKRTLGTTDPEEAKRRFAEEWRKVDAKWAKLRSGPTVLTEREAHEAAVPFYHNWLAAHRDQPSWQLSWHTELYEKLWTTPGYNPETHSGGPIVITDFFTRLCGNFAFSRPTS